MTFDILKQIQNSDSGISRRDMLVGLGAATAVVYSGSSLSSSEGHDDHSHSKKHDHSKHSPQMPGLLDAVNQCVDKGQRCISHCLVTYQEGDLELADCAAKTHEMLAICNGFSYLVTANSEYVKAYADVCKQVCIDCEKECRKHDHHIECAACAEACAQVVDMIELKLA